MVFEFRLGICGLFYTCFILRFCNSARNELSTRYVEFKNKEARRSRVIRMRSIVEEGAE